MLKSNSFYMDSYGWMEGYVGGWMGAGVGIRMDTWMDGGGGRDTNGYMDG